MKLTDKEKVLFREKASTIRENCLFCVFIPKLDLDACLTCSYMVRLLKHE